MFRVIVVKDSGVAVCIDGFTTAQLAFNYALVHGFTQYTIVRY